MKKDLLKSLAVIAMLALGFAMQSCEDDCQETRVYMTHEPVYMLHEEIRNAIASEAPRTLQDPGKIYLYGDWILVNERLKGIHIIDNTNPTSPRNVSFINIPGNVDMAVKNNILYVDSYIDLVSIDISDPTNISVTSRTENAFQLNTEHGYWVDETFGVITEWKEIEVTEVVSCGNSGGGWWGLEDDFAVVNSSSNGAGGTPSSNPSSGIGGSMARFTLVGDYLYTVSDNDLHPFDVSTSESPQQLNKIDLGWGIETIFPYNNHLFIGTQTGMQIFNIANPLSPSHVSTYEHIQSCDPVVVQGDYAYVTLRGGSACGNFENQLEVINISNLASPQLEYVYDMENPHGLGIDGSCLFICEGQFGLKTLDAADISNIYVKEFYQDIHAYDVIPYNNNLLMVGQDGLFQYAYDCVNDLRLISVVPIQRPN